MTPLLKTLLQYSSAYDCLAFTCYPSLYANSIYKHITFIYLSCQEEDVSVSAHAHPIHEIPPTEKALLAVTLQRLKIMGLIELLGFFSIFTCMILMRFGL
jgi:hypothetical protein